MVGGLDLHREQITFDALEVDSGESGGVGCGNRTGSGSAGGCVSEVASRSRGVVPWRWRAVRAGATWSRRSPRRASSRMSRRRPTPGSGVASVVRRPTAPTPSCYASFGRGELPESWIPPEVVWSGGAGPAVQVVGGSAHQWCSADPCRALPPRSGGARGCDPHRANPAPLTDREKVQLSPAGGERIGVGYQMVDATDREAQPLKGDWQRFGLAPAGVPGARRRPVRDRWIARSGGVERARRLPALPPLRAGVRHSGLDVTVDASDRRRAGGYLSRQGPETLRWALYEAAKNSSHGRSPDHGYYAK